VSDKEPLQSAFRPHAPAQRHWPVLLGISALLNAGLIGWIALARPDDPPALPATSQRAENSPSVAHSMPDPVPSGAVEPVAAEKPRQELLTRINDLKESGASDEAIIAILSNEILRQLERAGASEYWKPRAIRDVQARIARDELRIAYRSALREALGDAVAANPALAEVFAPNSARWSYLPPELRAGLETEITRDLSNRLVGRAGNATMAGDVDRQQRLRAMLGDTNYFEYSLRESALADQLLGIDFNFTEQEFRQVFSIWSKSLGTNQSDLRGIMRAGERADDPVMMSIQAALGSQRFAEYRRAQDPVYKLVRSTVRFAAVDPAKADPAYAVIEQTKLKAAQLMGKGGPVIGTATRKNLEQLKLERSRKLVALLGAPAAEVLERSMGPFDAMDLSIGMFPVVAR